MIDRFAFALVLLGATSVCADGFYKQPQLFSTRPAEDKSIQTIARFGPVGVGIDLVQPAFTMQIQNVEAGSPAAATGKLKVGQIIESINGQKLADIDPRIQLGDIITAAEASDGVVRLRVLDQPGTAAEEVLVRIPVLGAYSKTWPLNCPKSDKIVRGFADYLAKKEWRGSVGLEGMELLFLLSTGEEQDLAVARKWVRTTVENFNKTKSVGNYAWFVGYGGVPLAEYYLRTGDESVLPVIQALADTAKKTQYLDGWAGRGGVAAVTYGGGGGHLNAGGTAVVTFLMLAQQCGVNVDQRTLHSALAHYFRFAGRGNNPYGDNKPEVGMVDNGKNGNLAFAMAAAASLTPNGEQSIYAAARDTCAMTSFYTTTFMLHGHTGGGIGEVWRSAAMGLLHGKKPAQYRQFMDQRRWHYELSRRWDGSFGILGGAGYDKELWGAGYALTYTVPRKTLRITGTAPTKFVKPFKLPERPWGTKADDAFLALEAADDESGRRADLSQETLTEHSGLPLLATLSQPTVDEATLQQYAHHQDFFIRRIAGRKAMGGSTVYLGGGGGGQGSPLVLKWLQSADARVRRNALDVITTGDDPMGFLGKSNFDRVIAMIADPEESWYVKDAALQLVARAPADWVVPHVDSILSYLTHEEWWLQNSALTALTAVAADERCYRQVLSAIGELLATCQRYNTTANPMRGIREKLKTASPAVQKLAAETLREAYTDFAGTKSAPGGQDITSTYESQVNFIATSLADVPGGYDLLYRAAKRRYPNASLPHEKLFLGSDPDRFSDSLRQAIAPIIRDRLIYEYIGANRIKLLAEIQGKQQSVFLNGTLHGLVDLYRKVGVQDYNWHKFGPDLVNAQWEYFTFDPPEKQLHEVSPWRYRPVTYPAGMENWYLPQFDSAKAGWKTGQSPFGQYAGKLVTDRPPCADADCHCSDPMKTLWDKEVLLLRGSFTFPPLKPGHVYRVRVGSGQHVGSGDGYRIYINGKQLVEAKEGVGKRQGGNPRGGLITAEFIDEFNNGPVNIAATSFLRYGSRAIVIGPPVPQGIFSVWLEEMKLPPLDAAAFRKAATLMPMLSSEWQSKQDPENAELQSDDDRFRYDGKFAANPAALGAWQAVALVNALDEFDPAKKPNPGRTTYKAIALLDGGETDSESLIWSGNTLMDLDRYQALKMDVKKIAGQDYLLVESGGFSEKHPIGWRSQWIVFKRQ